MSTRSTGKRQRVAPTVLKEVIRRIVQTAQPERIILFGSAVRGAMGTHSDIDLLVVKGGEYNRSRLLGEIYLSLRGIGQAVDVILVTPEEVERYGQSSFLVIAPALEEGKEVYHA